jgi:hypothetical protein
MKNKNLALVAVLFTISVIMAFANGPTPQVVIDTDQIIDGAVTILKTDGVAANDLSNVTPATGRSALGLGTISTKAATDYVATSALALRLDTTNASISNNLDVAGDVGAATVNGVAPLTAAEKTQALVGSTTVNFLARDVELSANFRVATTTDTLYFRSTHVGNFLITGVISSYFEANAGIAAGASVTCALEQPNGTTYMIVLGTGTGVDSQSGAYVALVTRQGTSMVAIELADPTNRFTITFSGYHWIITNNGGNTVYTDIHALRIGGE